MLGELRALDGEAGPAVSAYLDLVGWRLLDGFDISGPCALELPDVLLRAIRVAAEGRDDGGGERRGADGRRAREGRPRSTAASSTSSSVRRG